MLKFGDIIDEELYGPRVRSVNPCVDVYGKGPEGVKCKMCKHLRTKQYANTYFKCDLRRNTNGPGTDHRKNWPVCGKYEPRESPNKV